MPDVIHSMLIKTCVGHLQENLRRINLCFDEIDENDLWLSKNNSINSIGNLILHLNGNISQYILSSVGGKEDTRSRAEEFESNKHISKEKLLNSHQNTIESAIEVIKEMNETALLNVNLVQGFKISGVEILVHVAEHYSYHTGQITYLVKSLKNKQLGYYKGIDLNAKNENR